MRYNGGYRASANVARGGQSSVVGDVRVFGSGERFAAVARDAVGKNCGKMDGKLCVFVGRGEVFKLRALDFANLRRAELFENGVDDRVVASHGFGLRDCADVYFGRFLLFLRLVFCRRREGCPVTSWFSITFFLTLTECRQEKRDVRLANQRSENRKRRRRDIIISFDETQQNTIDYI